MPSFNLKRLEIIMLSVGMLVLSAASECADSDSSISMEKADDLFYEARAFQSDGKRLKALQKFEEARLIFSTLIESESDSERGFDCRKKILQIDRDVSRIEIQIKRNQQDGARPGNTDDL